jgi:hypothetical protein
VPPQARVVALTGPNTGGKTAASKALGISVMMAQAGMYLRLAGDANGQSGGTAMMAEPQVRLDGVVCCSLRCHAHVSCHAFCLETEDDYVCHAVLSQQLMHPN